MSMRVRVEGAPGYADFEGTAVPGLHRYRINDNCPVMSVIIPDITPEPHVIPSEFVSDVIEDGSE
jgi:hypothetical protein